VASRGLQAGGGRQGVIGIGLQARVDDRRRQVVGCRQGGRQRQRQGVAGRGWLTEVEGMVWQA
jgi:hypothetical protein